MKKIILLLSACLMLVLCLCLFLEIQSSRCSVQFQAFGETVNQQSVFPGQKPKTFDGALPGVHIVGWTDSQGQPADPFNQQVMGNVTYQAVAYPQLTKHAPYLFADEHGFLNPDQALTCDDLAKALTALAAEGAQKYFPQLPSGSDPVSHEDLGTALTVFFDVEQVSQAFADSKAPTRASFAQGMNTLLGRDADHTFSLAEGYTLPKDITCERPDSSALLEASLSHTPAQSGTTWQDVELPAGHEPGFMNVDGWLYYVNEDHTLLRDGKVGQFYFGPDGRYTSGDAELDEMVAGILSKLMQENPDAQGMDLLRVVFDYCHQSFSYRRIYQGNPEYASTGWEIELAKDMFTSGKGNCYSFSAVFWALSRNLGYPTRAISGVCLSDRQPHSWCIIELDGADYIFDPQWQYDYTEREIFDKDMFKLPVDDIYFWGYSWDE